MIKKIIILLIFFILVFGIISIIKKKNISNVPQDYIKIAEIYSQNSNEVYLSADYHESKHYIIYSNGKVLSYDVYNKSGKTNKKYSNLSYENIETISNLLKENIDSPDDFSNTDGYTWTFIYYNESQEMIGKYMGYIYGHEWFSQIIDILENELY